MRRAAAVSPEKRAQATTPATPTAILT